MCNRINIYEDSFDILDSQESVKLDKTKQKKKKVINSSVSETVPKNTSSSSFSKFKEITTALYLKDCTISTRNQISKCLDIYELESVFDDIVTELQIQHSITLSDIIYCYYHFTVGTAHTLNNNIQDKVAIVQSIVGKYLLSK